MLQVPVEAIADPEMLSGVNESDRVILIVDDDLAVKLKLKEWLVDAGYKSLFANTAEQGWRVLTDFARQIWLVVVDVEAPGIYERIAVLDRIVEMAHEKNLQVIVMSSSEETITNAVERGCHDYITKPLIKQLLLKRVSVLKILSSIQAEKEAAKLTIKEDTSSRTLTLHKLVNFWDMRHNFVFPNAVLDNSAVESVMNWSFNIFQYSDEQLVVLAKFMFSHFNLLNLCGVRADILERFLVAIKQGYYDNHYHNWRHAFDVMQAVFVFLVHFCDEWKFTPLEHFALLIAGLCHDLGHPGQNNDYMIRTGSEIAMLYNRRSVLENCHSFLLFRLLSGRPDADILAVLPHDDKSEVERMIMECILSTDPSLHTKYVKKLCAMSSTSVLLPYQRLLIMQCIVKMADISNVARDWDGPGYRWSCLVSQEFFDQGDALKSYSMNVAPFLDRNATTIGKNSLVFIDGFALPLFQAIGQLFPNFDTNIVPILITNQRKWKEETSKL
jgi:CheY-like chemotaxis protein